jgi:hypothetical protein
MLGCILLHNGRGRYVQSVMSRGKAMEMPDKSRDDERVKPPKDEEQPQEEQDLDEALYDTFPASDPLPVTPTAEPKVPPRGAENDRDAPADKSKRS